MALSLHERCLLFFNLAYIFGFTLYYISIKNFEFMIYIAIMLFFFVLIATTLQKTRFNHWILWGLSLWGLLHMMGGGVRVGGNVLYAFELFPLWVTENFYVLKYDQFVHAYLYFVVVFVIWSLLQSYLKKEIPSWAIYLVLILMSVGVGALNEIAEFIAVLSFEETGVGGYYNTAWDIVFNTFGALIGVIVLHFLRRR